MTFPGIVQRITRSPWAALAWTVIIFLLMIIPKGDIPNQGLFGIPHLDKLVHVIMFGLFVWTWFHTLRNPEKTNDIRLAWLLFGLAALYGTGMEFVQHYWTDRDFDTWDIVSDSAGAAIAAWMASGKAKK
jgi:VanZ family protein